MAASQKNVDIQGSGIPARLKSFREQRQLTKADLAERAGLNYRTVHEVEAGRRDRVLEKTLMLLAAALEVPYADLLGGETPPGERTDPAPRTHPLRRRLLPAGVILLALLAVLLGARQQSLQRGTVRVEGGRLALVGRLFGNEAWHHRWESEISFCRPAPWSEQVLLVGLSGHFADGGRLLALDRNTGGILWEVRPDLEALKRAFGDEVIDSGNFHCHRFVAPDSDGDGRAELAVYFGHSLWYPACLLLVDADGAVRGQYANCGLLYDLAAVDLDHDGKDEILAAGTNNAPAYQGGTLILLDRDHFRGAANDAQSHPESAEPDSSRIRLVFPQFPPPFMDLMATLRLDASLIRSNLDAAGRTLISLDVGMHHSGRNLVVTLDADLRPLAIAVGDQFRYEIESSWPDSLTRDAGPTDAGWREDWLASHLRFDAGVRAAEEGGL